MENIVETKHHQGKVLRQNFKATELNPTGLSAVLSCPILL